MVDDAEGGDPSTPANFSPVPVADFPFMGINNNGQMISDVDVLLNGSDLIYIQQESNVTGDFVLYGLNDDAQMAGMLEEPIVGGVEGPTVGVILNVLPN